MKVYFCVALSLAVIAISNGQECGKVSNLDIDDTKTNLPWTAALRERSTNEVFCIGTLISSRHVLVGMKFS